MPVPMTPVQPLRAPSFPPINRRQDDDPRIRYFLLGFGALLVLLTLGTSVYFAAQKDASIVQYRVFVGCLAFGLMIASCMIFSVVASIQVDLKSWQGVGTATLALSGPAAAWVAVWLLMVWLWPESAVRPAAATRLAELYPALEDAEQDLGWQGFDEWVQQPVVEAALKDWEHEEYETFKNDIVNAVYNRGLKEKNPLVDLRIETTLVYLSDRAIKFQAISGTRNGSIPQLYIAASASGPETEVNSWYIVTDENFNQLEDAKLAPHGTWAPIKAKSRVNVLLIVEYKEKLGLGDYMYVDACKYLNFHSTAQCELNIVASKDTLSQVSMWKAKQSMVGNRLPIPVIFTPTAGLDFGKDSTTIPENHCSDLKKWAKTLDAQIERKSANKPAKAGTPEPATQFDTAPDWNTFISGIRTVIVKEVRAKDATNTTAAKLSDCIESGTFQSVRCGKQSSAVDLLATFQHLATEQHVDAK
jgi:hypothetical protein